MLASASQTVRAHGEEGSNEQNTLQHRTHVTAGHDVLPEGLFLKLTY